MTFKEVFVIMQKIWLEMKYKCLTCCCLWFYQPALGTQLARAPCRLINAFPAVTGAGAALDLGVLPGTIQSYDFCSFLTRSHRSACHVYGLWSGASTASVLWTLPN